MYVRSSLQNCLCIYLHTYTRVQQGPATAGEGFWDHPHDTTSTLWSFMTHVTYTLFLPRPVLHSIVRGVLAIL